MNTRTNMLPLPATEDLLYPPKSRAIAQRGAILAIKAVAAYGIAFLILGGLRYTLSVLAAPPDTGLWGTITAGVVAMAISSLVFCLVCAAVAAPMGILTALLAAKLIRWWDPHGNPLTGAVIGGAFAMTLVCVLHGLLAVNGLWSADTLASAAYLFWLGVPSLIYVAVATYGGWQYAHLLSSYATARA